MDERTRTLPAGHRAGPAWRALALSGAFALSGLGSGCSAGGPASTESGVDGASPGSAPRGGTQEAVSGLIGDETIFDEEDLQPSDDCNGELPIVYRDFNESHPDFEMPFSGDVVRRQLVARQLGPDRKPVFASSVGCPAQQGTPTACADWTPEQPVITSQTTFDQWYRDVDGVNIPFTGTLVLSETGPGTGRYVFDSNQFFPIASGEGFGPSPAFQGQNFLFTTEIHLNFLYNAGQRFSFRGDDDLWIFVNGRLALDLGSMHNAEQGTIDFDAQASELGIVPGRSYAMDIFHAERHTTASNFGFETNISCFTPSILR